MGQRLIISEEERKEILGKYIILEQTDSWKFEYVYDLPGKNVENIHQMIMTNSAIRSGTRLVTNNPNQIVYTKKVRVDDSFKKNAKMNNLMNKCLTGNIDFDITFLIKDEKTKMVLDNFVFELTDRSCPAEWNYGLVQAKEPQQSAASKLLYDKTVVWEKLVNVLHPNMQNFYVQVKNGFSGGPDSKDQFDF